MQLKRRYISEVWLCTVGCWRGSWQAHVEMSLNFYLGHMKGLLPSYFKEGGCIGQTLPKMMSNWEVEIETQGPKVRMFLPQWNMANLQITNSGEMNSSRFLLFVCLKEMFRPSSKAQGIRSSWLLQTQDHRLEILTVWQVQYLQTVWTSNLRTVGV